MARDGSGDNGGMTDKPESAPSGADADPALLGKLRAATELLEAVADDTSLLDQLPKPERHRLQQAVARVYHPDPALRRQRLKAAEREVAIATMEKTLADLG